MTNNIYTSKYHFAYKNDLKKKAREMRNNMTAAEKKIWYEYLRGHKLKFLRQKPILNYIVDFYCPAIKLVVEIDGETHLDKNDNQTIYDKIRTDELEKAGIKVVRFWNDQVLKGFDYVVEKLEKIVGNLKK